MKSNSMREKLADGEATYGGWLTIPNSFSAEVMSKIGFDWILVDLQHGLVDFASMISMLQVLSGSNSVPLVRPTTNEPGIIGRALDAGARGVVIPMINTREDAEAAVDAVRYAPLGKRSFGPLRASMDIGVAYNEFTDSDALCMVMLETTEAFDNIEDILSVPGIDGAFLGPGDLHVSLGLPADSDSDDERFNALVAKLVEVCKRRGLVAGVFSDATIGRKRVQQGFNFVSVATDFALLYGAAANALETARS